MSSDDGLSSCQVQFEACDEFVGSQRSNGWVLIEERFEDDGYSGATSDRPALQRVLNLIRKREVDRLVLYRLDRLSRSLLGCASILHELRECGVGLVIVTAPELGNSAQDSFMLNILAAFAEFEREMIASRIAESRVRLKARGQRIAGAVPFGYEADPRTKQLLQSASEAAAVKWMFDQAATAKTPAEIADAANAKGWRTKETTGRRTAKQHGGNVWTARQVIATLRNPVYLGLFRDKGDFRIGHHEAIVSHELFAAVSAQLEARRTRRPGKRYQIDWPLKGRITCAVCGTPMSPHTIRYRNFIYRYYRCRSTAGGQRPCGRQISAPAIEGAVRQNLEMLWGVHLDEDQIRVHVESVVYDHRVRSVNATFIRPPEPEEDPDSREVEVPLGKRRRRDA
ncbi:MAG: recombinase family protein [Acidobacteriia bacterium]|nr:recombinase family protein [Terriglobia bacterium]